MTSLRTGRRTPLVIIVALAIMIGPFLAWQGATGGETSTPSSIAPHGIVVVGDSITANYNNTPGDDRQGWWSIVGHRFGAHVTTYAQSGSGYLRPGRACAGNRFIDRVRAFTGVAPSLFIIEGGRNDWANCENGQEVRAPDIAIAHAVDRYLTTLQTFLPRSTHIIVMGPPWGPRDPANGVRVTSIVKSAAMRQGVKYVSTAGALTKDRVIDGVHPNLAGSRAIAAKVIKALGD